ncbi:MAG: epoxyqueuosine reductase QueH [Treponematales bacterium]
MELLLHACCGPCAVGCLAALSGEGLRPALCWFNPNIHPLAEYEARRAALAALAAAEGLEVIGGGGYGLRDFLSALAAAAPSAGDGPASPWDAPARCAVCYTLRLERTAALAAERRAAFSTTLLASPYQNHELIRRAGEAAAARRGAPFLYRDFRPGFREGRRAARARGLYMQKYCGCVFSEGERGLTRTGRKAGVEVVSRRSALAGEQGESGKWKVDGG